MSPRVLCVFPNDALSDYLRKGEVKPRYFNPDGLFEEIHVVSPAKADVEARQAQAMAGQAKLVVHPMGGAPTRSRIAGLMRQIRPDVLRAYNPLWSGYLAVWAARLLQRPSVISLHGNYDEDIRGLFLRQGKWLHFGKYLAFRWTTEPYVLRHADHVICAYQFPAVYARRYRRGPISIIYNRVDLSRFHPVQDPGPGAPGDMLRVLTVGRLVSEKNPACLIRAIQGVRVRLTVIGDGEQAPALKALARELRVEDQITWIPQVPYTEIHRHYQAADAFALATRYGGVHIPVLEALASGLSVVRAASEWRDDGEVRGEFLRTVENRPDAFRAAFQHLLDNPALRAELGRKARDAARVFDGAQAEATERRVYETVMTNGLSHAH